MKEYKISDIENLEKYVYEIIQPKINEYKETFKNMGITLKSELVPICQKNDSLIRITVKDGKDSFSISLCFIANGSSGGYYVSPLIKDGDVSSNVTLLLEQIKKVILEKGFLDAKQLFDGVQKDAYKQNNAVHKALKMFRFIFLASLVVVIGAIIVFLVSIP